ncbi:MAG: NADPH-dependent F420 reductase [Chloroflexi bacterium]|nr:NADPH-dependent F420 reductase [Chloroflexota bacterium]
MKIAVLGGTGKEGSGLALRWAHSGHQVIIGSRDASKAQRVAEELNLALGTAGEIKGMDNAAAAQSSDVAVLTVPYTAHTGSLSAVREALKGKVLVDVTVPVNPSDFTRVMAPAAGSAAREAQTLLGADVQVVSAFQNISATHLKKLTGKIDCDVLVCGDSDEAKKLVLQLVADAGMKGWDAGPLDNAGVVEGLTPILLGINRRHKIKGAGIRITGL